LLDASRLMAALAPTAISLAACLVACLRIFAEAAAMPWSPRQPWSRAASLGAALGLVVWLQPFVALSFPTHRALSAPGVLAALALSIAAATWTFAAFARCRGVLCVVAPGAVLGLGVAASHGLLLMSMSGAGDFTFDDAPFSLGVMLASGSTAAAFAALKVWHRPLVAAIAIASGLAGSQMLARVSIGLPPIHVHDLATVPLARLAPLVIATVATAVLALRMAAEARPATTAGAGRGSRRPSPAPRQAGTGSPRRAPARSAAAPAAGLGRPAPPAG
jgi:NO-binding membrane sensor protein with MHYT domain